jgi:thiamine biosynthesis lipoprotein
MEELSFRAMGCEMKAVLDADGPRARRALAQVPGWFATWEAALSRFPPDSELSRLNARAGQIVRVSEVLWEVLQAALAAARRTGGLVTPTGLGALEAAGYDRTFAALPAAGPAAPASLEAPAGPLPAWQAVRCLAGLQAVQVPAGVRLDFGGIAKGWAADRAARRLAAHAPALVDAGGDIRVSGPRATGEPWPVGAGDPRDADRDLALLALRGGAVATSGRDYRRWQRGGVWQHHILDPRTGHPATTDVLSATVLAPTAVAAESAAKAVLILGSGAGVAWLDAQPALAGLLVLDDGQVRLSRRLPDYYWS